MFSKSWVRKLVWADWDEDVKTIWEEYKNELCVLSHVLAGFLSCVAILISPVLSVLGFVIFLVYEMDQDWRKDDWLDKEMMEYGMGFFLGIVVLLLWWWLFGI